MADNVKVTVNPDRLRLNPGENGEIDITITNVSNVVDVFYTEMEGLDASWVRLDVDAVSIMPNDAINGILTIQPPRSSATAAQTYTAIVKVASRSDPSLQQSVPVVVDVEPFYSFEVDLRPQKATGAKGFYTLSIDNASNVPLDFNIEGRDQEDLCRFFYEPHQRPNVPAGEKLDISLLTDPGQRPMWGRPKNYTFTLTTSPEQGTSEPVISTGVLEVPPRITVKRLRVPNITRPTRSRLINRSRLRPGQSVDDIPNASPWWWNKWAWIACGALAVVLLIWLLVVLLSPGDGVSGRFVLKSGNEISYPITLPTADPSLIEATAEWKGDSGALDLILSSPDGSSVETLTVTPDARKVTFIIDSTEVNQGVSNWVFTVQNSSAQGELLGEFKLKFSKID